MPRSMIRSIVARSVLAIVFAAAVHGSASRPVSPEDAASMRQKIATIGLQSMSQATEPRRTPISEQEVNAYLTYDAKDQLPTGVVDPSVEIIGDGRLAGQATVDLDKVKAERQSTGFFDPMKLLSGRLPVSATGVLTTENGTARLDLESTSVSGIRVPKSLLQSLVSYYSKTEENPNGLNLDDPFPLPAGITHIEIGRGQAVVVQ